MTKMIKLKIEPIDDFFYHIYLDGKELPHIKNLVVNLVRRDVGGAIAEVTITMLAVVEAEIPIGDGGLTQ